MTKKEKAASAFDQFLRKVVSVPKEEIDRREAAWKAGRKAKRAKKPNPAKMFPPSIE